jgi:nucleoside-diphosphate-sugar epimerase
MIVYVTGAAGFLGSHLCDRLLLDGHTVVAFDNFVTGSRANLASALATGRTTLIQTDVSEPLDRSVLPIALRSPDLIMHFASPASQVDYGRDPIGTLRVNAFGIAHLCELAVQTSARHFMASTSESYGGPLEHPQCETYWGNVNLSASAPAMMKPNVLQRRTSHPRCAHSRSTDESFASSIRTDHECIRATAA